MARTKTIRSFSLYFTDKKELRKALEVADSEKWQAGYAVTENYPDEDFAIVEFWWDGITLGRLDEFLDAINNK